MRSLALGISVVAVAVCSLLPAGARANPLFPGWLQTDVPMPCVPHCTICHLTDAGGVGTITPGSMGAAWQQMFQLDGNLQSADALHANLTSALNAARASMQDSDHDMVPDDVELNQGRDPNKADPNAMICGAGVPTGPEYGCVRVARQGPIDSVGAAAGALVALIGLAAIRRRTVSKRPAPK